MRHFATTNTQDEQLAAAEEARLASLAAARRASERLSRTCECRRREHEQGCESR